MESPEKTEDLGAAALRFRTKCLDAARQPAVGWVNRLMQRFAIALQEERDLRDDMEVTLRAQARQAGRQDWFLDRVN